MNECKNYIHRYKCDTYNKNHDACKSCEMQTAEPIVFTITYVTDSNLKVYTKDTRWKKEDLLMTFEDVPPCNLFSCIDALTRIGNGKGYAVLFEVD